MSIEADTENIGVDFDKQNTLFNSFLIAHIHFISSS